MRRLLAKCAEVARGGNERPAEVQPPEAIDDDAGGKRIVSRADSFSQLAPPAAAGKRGWVAFAQDAEETPRHERAFVFDAAADEDVEIGRRAVAHDVHGVLRL